MTDDNKMPAFQFYTGDWLKDAGIRSLERHDQSVWFDMLCYMHQSSERGVLLINGNVPTIDKLARMLNLLEQNLSKTLANLKEDGICSVRETDGAIYCRRMVKDEALRRIRQLAGKQGGEARLLKQNSSKHPSKGLAKHQANTQAKRGSSSSSSSSSTDQIIDHINSTSVSKIKKSLSVEDLTFPQSLDTPAVKESLIAWLDHKTSRKEGYKNSDSLSRLLNHYEGRAFAFVEAVDVSIRNNWAGIHELAQQKVLNGQFKTKAQAEHDQIFETLGAFVNGPKNHV